MNAVYDYDVFELHTREPAVKAKTQVRRKAMMAPITCSLRLPPQGCNGKVNRLAGPADQPSIKRGIMDDVHGPRLLHEAQVGAEAESAAANVQNAGAEEDSMLLLPESNASSLPTSALGRIYRTLLAKDVAASECICKLWREGVNADVWKDVIIMARGAEFPDLIGGFDLLNGDRGLGRLINKIGSDLTPIAFASWYLNLLLRDASGMRTPMDLPSHIPIALQ